MKTKSLTFILIITMTTTSLAKTPYCPGKVITNNGKIIEGEIGVISPTYNEIKVKFINKNGKKSTFNTKHLKGYAFQVPIFNKETRKYEKAWVNYERKVAEERVVDFSSKSIFAEKTVDGTIKVFNHYAEVSNRVGQKVQHCFYVEKEGQIGFTKLTKKNYRAIMQALTADMPELSKLVGTGGYGYKYIPKMAKTYNNTSGVRYPLQSTQTLSR